MRRLFTLGLIASTALSLAMPAMAAPGDGRDRAASQNGGEGGFRGRGPSDGGGRMRQSPPPAYQQRSEPPPVQRSAPPAERRASPPPSAVQNARVPPSAVGTQWRGEGRPAPRVGTGGAEATNWPNQRRVDVDRQRQGGMRAYEGSRYENRQGNVPPANGSARQPDRGDSTGNRWNNGGQRGDQGRWNNGGRDSNGQWRGDDARPNDGRRDNDGRWNNGNGRAEGRWNNGDRPRYDNRGSNWDRNNWNGRRLNDRERWTEYRRWDNGGWRRDNRYDWQRYRSYHRDIYRMPRYYAPYGWNYGYSRFSIGIYLNSLLFANNYWIDDPYSYRLPPAYGYLRWIRYYDDALLVDIRDGYVVDVIHNFFW